MRLNEVSMDMQGMNPRQKMGTVRVYIHIIAEYLLANNGSVEIDHIIRVNGFLPVRRLEEA
jgi:hypothetical protein